MSPAAQDDMHRPSRGVDLVGLVRGRHQPAVLTCLTAQRERALVVMLVSTDHDFHLVAMVVLCGMPHSTTYAEYRIMPSRASGGARSEFAQG